MGSVRLQYVVYLFIYLFIFPEGLGDGKEITTFK